MIGTTVSHYKILEKLGEGGMGVVYKATDKKLDRLVALKFLPDHVAAGSSDLDRFTQEAKAAAGLNHPNICTIYGIEEAEGFSSLLGARHFIVMEFVDGQTLHEKKASLSQKQALDIGIQIAEGLAAAHENGIVHRDIKPENIMVRKDGRVQIMDFGLAKLRGASRLTKEGSTVGTAGYMSPEQVQGLETDHRSDIFSLGVLLFEMLTGQPPFKGVHETAIAYEVVNVDTPPLSSIRNTISTELDAIVLGCLEKDPQERSQSAKQIAIELTRAKRASTKSGMSRVMPTHSVDTRSEAPAKGRWIVFSALGLAGTIIGIALGWYVFHGKGTAEPNVIRFTEQFPQPTGSDDGFGEVVISSDGSTIAYSSFRTGQVYIRRLNAFASRLLPGAIDQGGQSILFSPDGRSVAYASKGKLVRQSIDGGSPVTICDAGSNFGGTWLDNGDLVFYQEWGTGLVIASSEGGSTPRPLTTLRPQDGERAHVAPHGVPGGNYVLFTIWTGRSFQEANIAIADLKTGAVRIILRGGSDGRCAPGGILVFERGATIMAAPFDVENATVTGEAVPVLDHVRSNGTGGVSTFDISSSGTIVYQDGDVLFSQTTMTVYPVAGGTGRVLSENARFGNPLYASDGLRLCVTIYGPIFHIGVYDLRKATLTPLTFSADNWYAAWKRDGSEIAYASNQSGKYQVYSIAANGGGSPVQLFEQEGNPYPTSWSPDGSTLVYTAVDASTGYDVWLYTPKGDPKNRPLLRTSANETGPVVSPDGRWLAYASDAGGADEIYLTQFPSGEGKWRVSNGGGHDPRWGADGKRLYYKDADIFVVGLTFRGEMRDARVDVGRPSKVLSLPDIRNYDVSPDDRSLIVARRAVQPEQNQLHVVVNWTKELAEKLAHK